MCFENTLFMCNFYFPGVDERVKADKRKLRDLDCDEVTKKKQKKNNADKAINKDVKEGKKSHKRKGIQKCVIHQK